MGQSLQVRRRSSRPSTASMRSDAGFGRSTRSRRRLPSPVPCDVPTGVSAGMALAGESGTELDALAAEVRADDAQEPDADEVGLVVLGEHPEDRLRESHPGADQPVASGETRSGRSRSRLRPGWPSSQRVPGRSDRLQIGRVRCRRARRSPSGAAPRRVHDDGGLRRPSASTLIRSRPHPWSEDSTRPAVGSRD